MGVNEQLMSIKSLNYMVPKFQFCNTCLTHQIPHDTVEHVFLISSGAGTKKFPRGMLFEKNPEGDIFARKGCSS